MLFDRPPESLVHRLQRIAGDPRGTFRKLMFIPRYFLKTRAYPARELDTRPFIVLTVEDPDPSYRLWYPGAGTESEKRTAGIQVALPIRFSSCRKLAIVHAHYGPEAMEICHQLSQVLDCAVALSSSSPTVLATCLEHLKGRDVFSVLVPNRGRDVLPFLAVASCLELDGFTHFVKVHTKRSPHLSNGRIWFSDALSQLFALMKDEQALASTLDPDVPGLAGAMRRNLRDFERHNKPWLREFIPQTTARKEAVFIPGTMFVGTRRYLELLNSRDLLRYRFEEENAQLDGCLHHALERYFGYLAVSAGGVCRVVDPM